MSLADILRSGIATARTITLPLHVTVTHKAWTGQDYEGTPTYDNNNLGTQRLALVERKQKLVRSMSGTEEMSSTYIAFIEEVAPTTPTAGFTRTNPIDVNDVFTLPDGTTGPVLAVDGFFDGGTSVPYYSQIWLG